MDFSGFRVMTEREAPRTTVRSEGTIGTLRRGPS
jgi:hypothetical protein